MSSSSRYRRFDEVCHAARIFWRYSSRPAGSARPLDGVEHLRVRRSARVGGETGMSGSRSKARVLPGLPSRRRSEVPAGRGGQRHADIPGRGCPRFRCRRHRPAARGMAAARRRPGDESAPGPVMVSRIPDAWQPRETRRSANGTSVWSARRGYRLSGGRTPRRTQAIESAEQRPHRRLAEAPGCRAAAPWFSAAETPPRTCCVPDRR